MPSARSTPRRTRATRAAAGALLASSALSGCAVSSHELLAAPLPARAAATVQVLFEPPHERYRSIAVVAASSRGALALGVTARQDIVIERLKREAGRLGADAVLLQELGDQPGVSVGTQVGVWSEGPRGTVDLGLGATHALTRAFGRGLAIVREGASSP